MHAVHCCDMREVPLLDESVLPVTEKERKGEGKSIIFIRLSSRSMFTMSKAALRSRLPHNGSVVFFECLSNDALDCE